MIRGILFKAENAYLAALPDLLKSAGNISPAFSVLRMLADTLSAALVNKKVTGKSILHA